MARSYRMTPARRAALRKAQQASARKRKGSGKGKTKAPRSYKSARRRQNAKLAGVAALYVAASAAGIAASNRQQRRASAHRSRVNRAHNDSMIRRHTGTSTGTVLRGARAHGGGPTSANRVFVGTRHGTVSVRRRHY